MSQLLTKAEWQSVLPSLKYILSDCDGVLWNGDQAIDGARGTFSKLRAMGKSVCFVTNNSTKTRREGLEKFHKLNFEATLDEIYCTSYATAAFLREAGVASVYLIGSPALLHEIREQGIDCNDLGPDSMDGSWSTWVNVKLDRDVQAVVVGFDADFTMAKTCRAASYLLNEDCKFIATNQDETLPTARKDIVVPGTGCFVACIETASGRRPTVVGKPNATMVELLKGQFGDLTAENTLFIGDRLNTDIELGRRQGFRTLLVESGVHKRNDIEANACSPTYYVPSLKEIEEFMKD